MRYVDYRQRGLATQAIEDRGTVLHNHARVAEFLHVTRPGHCGADQTRKRRQDVDFGHGPFALAPAVVKTEMAAVPAIDHQGHHEYRPDAEADKQVSDAAGGRAERCGDVVSSGKWLEPRVKLDPDREVSSKRRLINNHRSVRSLPCIAKHQRWILLRWRLSLQYDDSIGTYVTP